MENAANPNPPSQIMPFFKKNTEFTGSKQAFTMHHNDIKSEKVHCHKDRWTPDKVFIVQSN